ncbi:hypothetical protein D3C78_977890 [compost metagenome]
MAVEGGAIDPHLATHGGAVGRVTLGVDAPAGAVLTEGHPAHHIAAVGQTRNGWLVLIGHCGAVDPYLATYGGAVRRVTLGIDAPAAAILVE